MLAFYFDLRRYGEIEKNNDCRIVLDILSGIHKIIEEDMTAAGAEFYCLHTDNCVYVCEDTHLLEALPAVLKTKINTDNFLAERGFSSRLSVCCAAGEAWCGKIVLKNKTVVNIFGSVMNELEKIIRISASSSDKKINEGIILSSSIYALLRGISKDGFSLYGKIENAEAYFMKTE